MDEPIPLGEILTRDDGTPVQRVRVVSGSGIWAYFCLPQHEHPHHVVADIHYNKYATHFAGQLERIYKGSGPEDQWLLLSGYPEPPREIRKYVEDEDYGLPRMEHRS